jgi:pimeloyl-ACP methyl ester carboxylesterase
MSLSALAFDRAGPAGQPVILLHGIGGGKAMWRRTVPALAAAGFDAIALDLPGYGESASLPAGGVDPMAGAVLGLMDALGLRQAAVLGHSMGGMVAQAMAALAPDRLQALVLACTSPAFGKGDGAWQAKFVADRLAPLDAGGGMPALAARLVPAMVSPSADTEGVALAQAVMAAVPEATYRTVLAAIVSFDRRADLPAIAVPTLCLAGELDATAPPKVLRGMAERIPGAEFAQIAAAGHIANVEQPAAFEAVLIDFLHRHPVQEPRP